MSPFNRLILLTACTALTALFANAQDISGEWQGTLKAGAQELRILLQIAKSDNGVWRATMLSIDQSPDRGIGLSTTSFSLDGSSIRFAKYPGPGATSRTLLPGGSSTATRFASAVNSGIPFPVSLAYHLATEPSIPMPL